MKKKTFSEPFSVDSALLQELGERLVTTPHVALAELVKNSYDADSTEVYVTISEGITGGPEIVVEDNGVGMTLDEIRRFWMKIGTTHKEDESFSKTFGRPLTGSKGIGRFCVRRLGTKAVVTSTAKVEGGFEHTQLTIDWLKFAPGGEVTKVEIPGSSEITRTGKTGVKLAMSGLDEIEWQSLEDQRSYGYLKRRLATLTANQGAKRRGFTADPGFQVFLNAPALEGSNEDGESGGSPAIDIRDSLMNAGWALLTAKVDRKGVMTCEIDAAQPVGRQSFQRAKNFKALKDVSLRLGIFVEGPEWNRDSNLVPAGQLKQILKQWGGVQLRYKGIRIFPYGDEGDDWLEIEKDKARRLAKPSQEEIFDFAQTLKGKVQFDPARVLLNMLSYQNYLGGVTIGEKQKGLEPKSDRMGFLNNRTFREVRTFARFAIDWAVVWRSFALAEKARSEAEKQRKRLEKGTGKQISQAEQGTEALKILRQGIAKVKSALEKNEAPNLSPQEVENLGIASSLLESEFKSNKSDLRRFQMVASAATLTLLYQHETRFLTHSLRALSSNLRLAEKEFTGNAKRRSQEVQEALLKSLANLEALRQLTDEMGVLNQKVEKGGLDLRIHAKSAADRFERIAESYGIEISLEIPQGLQVGPILKGELLAVLLNVLSNGIKAVIAGGASKPLIEMRGYRSGKKVALDIQDNGIGVRSDDRQTVFMPLVSDPSMSLYDALEERISPQDRSLLGQGSGLGLSIVQGILENRNGSTEFREPERGWATCLHIEFATP